MKIRIVLIVVCLLVTISAVIVTMAATGKLSLSNVLDATSDNIENVDNSDALQSVNDNDFFVASNDTLFDINSTGVFFDIENDYLNIKDLSAFDLAVQAAKQMYCDVFFVCPSLMSNVIVDNGVQIDLIQRVKELNRFGKIILTVDARFFISDNMLRLDPIRKLLEMYEFDAVLIHDEEFLFSDSFLDSMSGIIEMMEHEYEALELGICVFAGEDNAKIKQYVENGSISFVVMDAQNDGMAICDSYKVLSLNNSACLFFAMIDHGDDEDYVSELMYGLCDYPFVNGMVFSTVTSNENTLQSIASYFYEPDSSLLVQNIIPDAKLKQIAFDGVVGIDDKLYCNTNLIAGEDGTFHYNYPLADGLNSIVFASNGKKNQYFAEVPYLLISHVYPGGDNVKFYYDESFSIYAVCKSNALVSASLGDMSFAMTATDEYPDNIMPDVGYSVYMCVLTFDKPALLGDLKITAALNGSCEIVIACHALEAVEENVTSFNVVDTKSLQRELDYDTIQGGYTYSYYTDYGLSNSLMCEIIKDDAEQLTSGAYDTYQPTKSSLPVGAWDYVVDIVPNDAGYVQYELASGAGVLADDAKLIINGNTLPSNTVSCIALNENDPSVSKLMMHVDWPVAVTTQLNDQLYEVGYSGYGFNVSDFTASYLDVIFPHTSQATGFDKIQFADESAVSNVQVLSNDSESLILRFTLRQSGHFYGCDLHYDEVNGNLIFEIKNNVSKSLLGKTVMIDPGHGGHFMTGTALQDESVAEKQITLSVALKLKGMLEARGADVIMTRMQDEPLSLEERIDLSTSHDIDAFISLHCDGMEDADYSGTHSFYYASYSQPLALSVHNRLVEYYRSYIYSPGTEEYNAVDYGIKYYPFAMIRSFECPAVMVEIGFMTNITEGFVLTVEDAQFWIAEGIAVGLNDYFVSY